MNRAPNVGERVVLNSLGLRSVRFETLEAMRQASRGMTVTYVDPVSMTEPEPTWVIEVDNEEVNHFLLDHTMFDLVQGDYSAVDPVSATKASQPGPSDKPSSDASGQW